MGSRIGKISAIKRTHGEDALENTLSDRNMTRVPGTAVFKTPYKELDGRYRTGLDENATYIKRIQDKTERDLEIELVKKTKKELQEMLGDVDLSPRSSFWNYTLAKGDGDPLHVQLVKLTDGDNFFDKTVPFQLLAFAWLRVHPTIASSLQAYERGEYPGDIAQFYVADDEIEAKVEYKQKTLINKAIGKFDAMTPEKKRKVARLLGLPVTDSTRDEDVYNMVDNMLKDAKRGNNSIDLFNGISDMKENLLNIKDLVEQAISNSVYRLKHGDKIYEGELEVAKSKDELVKYLANDDHQEDYIALEKKVKAKKLLK